MAIEFIGTRVVLHWYPACVRACVCVRTCYFVLSIQCHIHARIILQSTMLGLVSVEEVIRNLSLQRK